MIIYSILTSGLKLFHRISWIIVIILLLYCCWIQYLLKHKTQDYETCLRQSEELNAVLEKQNQAVKQLESDYKRRMERFESSNNIAETKNQHLKLMINAIQNQKGSYCHEAIPMVDEIIDRIQNQY